MKVENGNEDLSGVQALFSSFLIIFASEIGDKTFLIAAVMAMHNSRLLIFSAAMGALLVMTLLSAIVGQILPELISKQYTEIAASALFIFFGIKLINDASKMTGKECMEELEEVTAELGDSGKKIEEGNTESKIPLSATINVWVQTFVMTFLAEWGDRSQIATVALSGANNFLYVSIGGIAGHAVCSGIAVIGGRMLASRISIKKITLMGAFLFMVFGVFGLYSTLREL